MTMKLSNALKSYDVPLHCAFNLTSCLTQPSVNIESLCHCSLENFIYVLCKFFEKKETTVHKF